MGRVDLHLHILHGVDDGAKTPADSLAMARLLVRHGYDAACATPHLQPGRFADRALTLARLAETRALFAAENIPLELLQGGEHLMDSQLHGLAAEGLCVPYGADETRYVLMEFQGGEAPPLLDQYLFQLRRRRIRPVLAHPERYPAIRGDKGFKLTRKLIDEGLLFQLDLESLLRSTFALWGGGTTAHRLVEENLIHFVSTDMHEVTGWDEKLPRAFETLTELVGPERARTLTETNPRRVLAGQPVELPPE